MAKKLTYKQLEQQVKRLEKRVTKLKGIEEQLRGKHTSLRLKTKEFRELNRSLKVLLAQRDKDRRALEERVLSSVKELVVPYTKKLKTTGFGREKMTYLRILQSNLNDIVSPFVHQLTLKCSALTPTEIQVAQLIREGKNAREIGMMLNSSKRTIESHRLSIRKKLGMKDTKSNLKYYLLSM